MRIFLMEWSTEILVESAKQLKERGVEIVYWLSGKLDLIPRSEFSGTIFHNTFLGLRGFGAEGINEADFKTPSRDILEALYECESYTLLMMQRLHFADDFSGLPFQKRKLFYLGYVKYWFNILKQFNPDALVFSDTPHMVGDFVAYHLAKILGIRTIMFDITRLPERLAVLEDFQEGNGKKIIEIFNKQGDQAPDNLSDDLLRYYSRMVDAKEIYYPFIARDNREIKKAIRVPKLASIFRNIAPSKFFKKTKQYLKSYSQIKTILKIEKRRKIIKKFRDEYLALQRKPDLQKPFVFFALHYQPENSTCPMGGVFANQLLAINILSFSLPPGWLLYVKEHPAQWIETKGYQGRYQGFYKNIARYKNVVLIPVDSPTNKLTNKSQAVATITGTVGLEAIFKGKPVLVFGYSDYSVAPFVFRVSNIKDCRIALEKIKNGFKISRQEVFNFLVALDKVDIKGYLGTGYVKETSISPIQSSINITEAVYNFLIAKRI